MMKAPDELLHSRNMGILLQLSQDHIQAKDQVLVLDGELLRVHAKCDNAEEAINLREELSLAYPTIDELAL